MAQRFSARCMRNTVRSIAKGLDQWAGRANRNTVSGARLVSGLGEHSLDDGCEQSIINYSNGA